MEEKLYDNILKHCLEKQNFSCAYIQKVFNLTYPQAGIFLDWCEKKGYLSDGKIVNKKEGNDYGNS